MRRLTAFAAALVTAIVAVGMIVGSSSAQVADPVYEACEPDEAQIRAAALPGVVDGERCPIAGREIVDGVVKVVAPRPGEGIYAEILTTRGAQELDVSRRADGILVVRHAGDDVAAESLATEAPVTRAANTECTNTNYTDNDLKVRNYLRFYFNVSTTPDELTPRAARGAILRGGQNIYDTRNLCRMGDRVPATLIYQGNTTANAGIGDNGSCPANDGKSVVVFGTLPSSALASTCNHYYVEAGYDRPASTDLKIDKAHHSWTTNPYAPSCRGRYDLEGLVTHERGHTFGLGHVSEATSGRLTMSPISNGPCQASERTLGRGDVLGLANKYR